MPNITVSELRADLATAMNRVAFGKERIIIERQGKPLAALVPMEDIEALEAFEDRLWVELAEASMAEPGQSVPWEQVKRDAGL